MIKPSDAISSDVIVGDVPPLLITRNEFGLIKGYNYTFNTDGAINWRKMIKPEFLVPNKQVFERRQKPIPTSIEGLEDKELLILLGGIKELAQCRGYTSLTYSLVSPHPEYVVATCQIQWLGNFETSNQPIVFSAIGDASTNNTNAFGKNFLGPIAENRAFVRCVRNFLKINIVSQEELGGPVSQNPDKSETLLRETMESNGVTFAALKNALVNKDKYVDSEGNSAETYTCITDIPMQKRFDLIARIKQKASEKSK